MSSRSRLEYGVMLRRLLPEGAAWSDSGTSTLARLLLAFAEEYRAVEVRGGDLVLEVFPRTSTELLEEWEEALALPGDCIGPLQTVSERQRTAAAKLAAYGGQTAAYYVAIAALLGIVVEVDECHLFQAGDHAGDRCYGAGWEHAWRVLAPHDLALPFVAGAGQAGDPLATFANLPLECLIGELRPAHTTVHFAYTLGIVSPAGPATEDQLAVEPLVDPT